MLSSSLGHSEGNRTLAILNHRGEPVARLRSWFQDRGWKVRTTKDLAGSLEVLADQDVAAVAVIPLTLTWNTLEWEALFPLLSPRRSIPWLLLPWQDSPPANIASLLRGRDAMADWLPSPFSLPEAEARLQNLLRRDSMLASTKTRAAALESQLITDHKTGLANDRHFRKRLSEEFERTQRHGAPMSIILLDIDDFKKMNDAASYEFGDLGLRTTGQVLRQSVRSIDIPARIGGDEFGIILPNTTLEEALAVAHRIRSTSEQTLVEDSQNRETLRYSQGVAMYQGHHLQDATQLFLRANDALKSAKAAGKNQVQFYDPQRKQGSAAINPPLEDSQAKADDGKGKEA
jgi:diguanylate cyclase (GGDEF)-like protein